MRLVQALAAAAVLAGLSAPAIAAESVEVPHREWPHSGLFGTFDLQAMQRGAQVYFEVCSACHSMRLLSYRNLRGIGFNEDEVRAIAAKFTVIDGPNDEGQMFERPARPSDRFRSPFANENAARAANNGALPPDLSLIVKARHAAENHVFGVLVGYADPPPGVTVAEGMYYNKHFPGHQIAMAPPLSPDQVAYSDGTSATVEQMAADLSQFLTWAAEPNLVDRKRTGVKVILFLIIFTGLLYAVKRKVWANAH